MMLSNKNNFSAADIERYHSGGMTAEERHALEKAALDDPFLADALEGYAFTTTSQADLVALKKRLEEKTNDTKVVPFFRRYRWISAAAVFILIAGTALFIYTNSSKQNSSVALDNKKNVPGQQNKKPEIQTPFSNPDSSNANSVVMNATKERPKHKESITGDYKFRGDVVSGSIAPVDSSVNRNRFALSEEKQGNDKYVLTDKNVDSSRFNGVPLQNIQTQNSRPETNFYANRTNVSPTANNTDDRYRMFKQSESRKNDLALKDKDNSADTIRNLNIVLQPQTLDSTEVVTIGNSNQKKSMDKYPRVTIDTLEPAEGYVKFDDYIAANLKMPEEIQAKQISGEVQLSFDVDKDGQPTNIAVVKSLCEKCDEEAIRLLKEGPKWKKKRNKKGKITIKF